MKKNRITPEIREMVESSNEEQLDRFLKFLEVLNAGGTEAEAFTAAEGL